MNDVCLEVQYLSWKRLNSSLDSYFKAIGVQNRDKRNETLRDK
jgi:hypothetical protein